MSREAQDRIKECLETQSSILDLSECKIMNLSELKELNACTHLEQLNLSRNQVRDLTPLKDLSNITKLNLASNKIINLTVLGHLQNLNFLDLSWNSLRELRPLQALQNLTFLNLSHNHLRQVPLLQNLDSLNLSSNIFDEISNLGDFQSLISLDISWNHLKSIPSLKNLQKVQLLNLQGNRLNNINTLFGLKELNSLNLAGNQLRDFTHLNGFRNLVELVISYNQLNEIPVLQDLQNLTSLSISRNQLKSLAPLQYLQSLTSLDISWNEFTDLTPLKELYNLRELSLSVNKVRDLTPLVELHNLRRLLLLRNQVTDIAPLQNLQNLTELDLKDNQISYLNPLKSLHKLTWLVLSDNRLSDFRPLLLNEAYRLGRITWLNVSDNPNPALNKIVDQGYEALKAYYDSLAVEGRIQNDQLKVILLGNSTAGKTSLLRYWGQKAFSDTQTTTHGIATPLDITLQLNNPDETFRANVWDFGGQDYYHATHRLFITPDSTYVLVCNQALENKPGQELTTEYMQIGEDVKAVEIPVQHYPYRFWLQTLAFLTKAGRIDESVRSLEDTSKLPKLFLVENKCGTYESNQQMQLDRNLASKLPFEVISHDFYHLDIREAWLYNQAGKKHEEGAEYFFAYNKFEKALLKTLREQINENRYEVHKNYPIIRDILATLATWQQQTDVSLELNQLLTDNKIAPIDQYEKLPVWMTYAQYQDLVRKNSKSAEPHWLSLHIYLQNLCGRIFHFNDIPALADIVFIDPNWLHQTMYQVLSQEVLNNKGEFTLDEADTVIDGNILDAARFIEVMMTFELVFEIPNQSPRRFVAPQYLPLACPLTDPQLQKTKEVYHTLALTLQFPHYLPPSLISRIISLKGHLIKDADEPLWRNGLIYLENKLSTMLLCTPDERKIELFLSGDDKTARQKALRQFMELLEAKFPDELAEVLISLPSVGTAKWKHLYQAKKEQKTGAKNYDESAAAKLVDSRAFAFLFENFVRTPINIFVCYAHDDHAEMLRFVEPLKKELASLAKQHNLTLNPFTDQALQTGDRWHEVLTSKIRENDVLICLLSPSFFTSGYIQQHEYGQVMRDIAAGERDSLIAPVYLKPCYVAEVNPIGNLQFFKPLASTFNLSNDIQDFCFDNLLHQNGGSYVNNYVSAFVDSIAKKLSDIWERK